MDEERGLTAAERRMMAVEFKMLPSESTHTMLVYEDLEGSMKRLVVIGYE